MQISKLLSKLWARYLAPCLLLCAIPMVSFSAPPTIVKDFYERGFLPFSLRCFIDTPAFITTATTCTTTAIPTGSRFVVEHISGQFVVKEGNVPDMILATVTGQSQQIYVPWQNQGRPLNYGGNFGVGTAFQFGSTVKMYVDENNTLSVRGDANGVGRLTAVFVGYLVKLP